MVEQPELTEEETRINAAANLTVFSHLPGTHQEFCDALGTFSAARNNVVKAARDSFSLSPEVTISIRPNQNLVIESGQKMIAIPETDTDYLALNTAHDQMIAPFRKIKDMVKESADMFSLKLNDDELSQATNLVANTIATDPSIIDCNYTLPAPQKEPRSK